MTTILIAVAVFAVAMLGMGIGMLVAGRSLRGSCGGLANLSDEGGNPLCESCTVPSGSCRGVEDGRRRSTADDDPAGDPALAPDETHVPA